ncbi:MAG: SDR family NAD(P)-dependent oxidoreductase, partial [Luteibacter sp.]
MKLLNGKVAIVTGGTSGIGQASAELFASEGARVVIVGRRRVEGEAVRDTIRMVGGEAEFVEADLSDDLAVGRMVTEATACFGRIDIWFNNAGVGGGRGGIEERQASDWDRIASINARSAFLCLKAEVAQLRAQ